MFCTPIFIHSFVVFVRLHWFERRFQNIVKDARSLRRSRTRTRTEAKDESEVGINEKGVEGRQIVVLRDHDLHDPLDPTGPRTDPKGSDSTTESSEKDQPQPQQNLHNVTFHRNITFADELPRQPEESNRLPMIAQQLTSEQHIAIRENQRNPKDKSTLRIPGPRDYDLGLEPEPLENGEDHNDVAHVASDPSEQRDYSGSGTNTGQIPLKLNVNSIQRLAKKTSDPTVVEDTPTNEQPPNSGRIRPRIGTFSSLKEWASKENETVAPYLSWQPTIGRNSAFVDLTEEQREELGGIEYRSLKTLAVILVCE